MKFKLDDWFQTPLGDFGMELRDLIIQGLTALMKELKEDNLLDEKTQKAYDHLKIVIEREYEKLVS